jgi:hypothetical protein
LSGRSASATPSISRKHLPVAVLVSIDCRGPMATLGVATERIKTEISA